MPSKSGELCALTAAGDFFVSESRRDSLTALGGEGPKSRRNFITKFQFIAAALTKNDFLFFQELI